MTEQAEYVRAIILERSDHRFGGTAGQGATFTAKFCTVKPNGAHAQQISPYTYPDTVDEHDRPTGGKRPISQLAGLELILVTSQDHDDRYWLEPSYSRDWLDRLNLVRLQSMSRALQDLERGLAKLQEQDGPPKSFGQYVARCARVLGVNHFLLHPERERQKPLSERYGQLMTTGEGATMIDMAILDFHQKYPATEAAA